jgi:hypothetical protein
MRLAHHHPSLAPARQRGLIRSGANGEPGYVLVTFALMLVPLLLMAGLAIDVGGWYNRAADIQKAADAAALAGVVWLPDEDLARQYALEAAARNGFVHGGDITVTVLPVGDRQLRVTIRDASVGSFIATNFGVGEIDLQRRGTAEYVLPVPLGSPRNFFGTGILDSGYDENLWVSVNTWCTDKVDGDRYQSPFTGNRPYGTDSTRCPTNHEGTYANPEYRPGGYEYYVEVPTNRTGNVEVLLFDARYNTSTISSTTDSALGTCTTNWQPSATTWTGPSGSSTSITVTGPAEYQTRTSTSGSWSSTQTLGGLETVSRDGRLIRYRTAGLIWSPSSTTWTGPSTSSAVITINGPAQYQRRSSTTSTSWSTVTNVPEGTSYSRDGRLLRYRTATVDRVCTEPSVDLNLYSGDQSYTFTLYAADNTPLSDADNPPVSGCSQTFTRDTPFTSGLSFMGSFRWNRLCTISTTMAAGRYILRVTNNQGERYGAGANNFAMVAKYTGAAYTPASALCDSRSVSTCPRVYGKDAISVFADQSDSTADFFLAEIEPLHVGKKLQVELFDPGEGGNNIRLRRPTGANTWTDATFSWTATNGTSGGPTTSLDVTNSRFNGHTVSLIIDLAGYSPPTNNRWWQVRYNFTSGEVTDRTTWSAKVVGDPVHLIEEE